MSYASCSIGHTMTLSLEALLRHAKRYGTEGVAETAAEAGMALTALTTLLVELDALDQAHTPRIRQRHKKVDVKAICEARAKKLLGITDDEKETT